MNSFFPKKRPTPAEIHQSDVTENDVLCGRGLGAAQHPGNQRYSRLVKEKMEAYQTVKGIGTSKAKRKIAESVIQTIHDLDPPGRFLIMKSSKREIFLWKVQHEQKTMNKVAQALREKPKRKSIDSEVSGESSFVSKDVESRSSLRSSLKRSMEFNSHKVRYIYFRCFILRNG
jgi:hypothetical protein